VEAKFVFFCLQKDVAPEIVEFLDFLELVEGESAVLPCTVKGIYSTNLNFSHRQKNDIVGDLTL
jgi:hypothetical protein